jgi:acetyltransferase-like isoleucine patch superfamily enzyme
MFKRFLKKFLIKIGLISEVTKGETEPKYKIGNVKYNNSHIDTLVPQLIEIGDNFVSAPGSIILAHDASLFRHTGYYRVERTVIGNDVFLGANAVILPGIKVGDGSIIGAGAVVTRNVEPYTVVAGNPAKFVCSVDEYIQKCEVKACLFKAPDSFKQFWQNKRLTKHEIAEFQSSVLSEIGRREADGTI